MTCDRVRPLLSDYHDDALSPAQRARVREHVVACASCRAVLERYDHLYASIRGAPAPIPAGLRRDVYASIAQLEHGRGRVLVPFGPNMWGALRAAGGTAALLAVLGGLVFASIHVAGTPGPASPLVSAQSIAAADTQVAAMGNVVGGAHAQSLPVEMGTAVAHSHDALSRFDFVALHVGKGTSDGVGRVSVPVQGIQRASSGAPRAFVRGRVVVTLPNSTPIVSSMAFSSSTPAPTIAPDEGLAYLRLDNIKALLGTDDSRADVAFHAFAATARGVILATPVADKYHQLFTGLTTTHEGRDIAYSAKGQGDLGGVFAIDPRTSRSSLLLPLPDTASPYAPDGHLFVKQVYATESGPLFITVVNQSSPTDTVTINVTQSQSLALTDVVTTPLHGGEWGFWYDYVVAPDRRAIAWTERTNPSSDIGLLKVSTMGTSPTTVTVGLGGHPVWSPDGTKLLYKSDKPAGLYVWSARDDSTRRVVALDSIDQPALDNFVWAPNGRYFAYVLRTAATSAVRLGDIDAPGYTWPAFQDTFIGSIAWAHAPAAVPATATVTVTPGTAVGAPVASPTSAPTAVPTRTPTTWSLIDNTDTPVDVLHSFYNAINRHEYRRAFGYLAVLPDDTPNFDVFKKGYANTLGDTVSLYPAGYQNTVNGATATCVGFALTAHQTDGAVTRFGGWYMARATTGPNGGWRIVMDWSHIKEGSPAAIPTQAQCKAPSQAAASVAPSLPFAPG